MRNEVAHWYIARTVVDGKALWYIYLKKLDLQ